MSDRSARAAAVRDLVRPRAPHSLHARLAIIAVTIVLTVAIHLVTGGRWTPVLIGVATITSLLAVLPRLSWLAKPVGTYLGLWLVFNLLRAGADETAWADRVLDLVPRLEAWLFGGYLPTAALQDRLHESADFRWYDYGLVAIYLSFFLAPYLVAALLLWRNWWLFWRYTLATAVLFVLAAVSFYVIPTAPPWLASDLVPDAGFAQIGRITESVLASLDLPIPLFSESTRDGVRLSEVRLEPNAIAAMPSIHFAATALMVFPARRAGTVLRYVVLAYTLLMGIALVYLGEHYVLDLVVGAAMALIGWVMAGRWLGDEEARSESP